jgi:hypothetical protein
VPAVATNTIEGHSNKEVFIFHERKVIGQLIRFMLTKSIRSLLTVKYAQPFIVYAHCQTPELYRPNQPCLLKYQSIITDGNIAAVTRRVNDVNGPKNIAEPVSIPPGKFTFIP